MAEKKTFPD